MRIDKFIWAVRLAKTRSIATKECNGDRVKLNEEFVKASKNLKVNDQIELRVLPIWKKYKVIDFPKSRVGAKLVDLYLKEITSKEDLDTLETTMERQRQMRMQGFRGRPTKRDRRKLDDLNF